MRVNGLSLKLAPLTGVDLLEFACVAATVAVMNVWLHDWELPLKICTVFAHLIVVIAARVVQPLDFWGLGFTFIIDMLSLAMQSGIYMGRIQEYDFDKNTHDDLKEYVKLGLLGGLSFATFLRLLGAGDYFVRGEGIDTYSVRLPWKPQPQMPATMVYSQPPQYQPMMPAGPTIAVNYPTQTMPYAYTQGSSGLGPPGIPVAYPR